MGDKTVLLTGGAGYIGSHVALDLVMEGYEVIILDDLSKGFAEAVINCELVQGDTGNKDLLVLLLEKRQIGAVMHLAGSTVVPESVRKPLMYYENNTAKSRNLIEACVECGVRRFVFSSTAAVYGIPDSGQVTLETPTEPVNPYGMSKLMTEIMLRDLSGVAPLSYAALRYFNVAGAAQDAGIGQRHDDSATHIIPRLLMALAGGAGHMTIHGDDYPTPDGTCVRDYIHVEDLVAAHVAGLERLMGGGASQVYNLGTGRGASVREVIEAAGDVVGYPPQIQVGPRREGDAVRLVSGSARAGSELNWRPKSSDLETILADAWAWHKTQGWQE